MGLEPEVQLLEPTARLHPDNLPPLGIALDTEHLVELSQADKRAPVIHESRRNREHRAHRMHGRGEMLLVANDPLHVGITHWLDVDRRRRIAAAAPVPIAAGRGVNEAVDELPPELWASGLWPAG